MSVVQDFKLRHQNALSLKRNTVGRFAIHFRRELIVLTDITWPTAQTITFGASLGTSVLSGGSARTPWGSTVEGSFSWQQPALVPGAGVRSLAVVFTPTYTQIYDVVVGASTIIINQAVPTITAWPTIGAITYGETLADSVLTGGSASVAGTFAWVSPTTAPNAGTRSYSMRFTPNSTNYSTVLSDRSIVINKATPTISTIPVANDINEGQKLSDSTWHTAGVARDIDNNVLAGTFTWVDPNSTPVHSVTHTVLFTPTDATNYATTTCNVYIRVLRSGDTGWVLNITNGSLSTISLPPTGQIVSNTSKIRWRGREVTGATEDFGATVDSGTVWVPPNTHIMYLAVPTINTTYQLFTKHRLYMSYPTPDELANQMPGEGEFYHTTSPWTRYTYTRRTGNAKFGVYDTYAGNWSYVWSVRTYYKHRLHTQFPRVTIAGVTTQHNFEVIGTGVTAWYDIVNATLQMTHNSNAYSDSYGGASGRLDYQVMYQYYTTG